MLYINGVRVKEPSGIDIVDEPIWASNTGRGVDGRMSGDLVAWKTTVNIKFPPMSFAESKKISDSIKNAGPFFDIKYNDFSGAQTTSALTTKRVYVANLSRSIYSLVYQYHTGITLQFVEQ